jgi:hypothetical protein
MDMTNENQNILRIKQLMLLKESQEEKSPADLLWDFINNEEDVDGSWISSRYMDYEKDGYFYFDFHDFKEYYEYFFPESENEDSLQNWEWALRDPYRYFEDDHGDSQIDTESYYYDSLDDKIKEKLKSLVTKKLGFRFKDTEDVGLKIQEIFTALGLADDWVSEYDYASRVARIKDFEKNFNEENCDYLSKIGFETIRCFTKYRIKPEHLLVMYSVVGDENLEYDELIVKYLQKKKMDFGLPEPYEFFWNQWNEEEFKSEYNGEFKRVLKKFKEMIEDASPKQIKKFGKTLKKVDDLGGFEQWMQTENGDRIMFLSYDIETNRIRYKLNKKNHWSSQVGTADIDTLINKIKNLQLDF